MVIVALVTTAMTGPLLNLIKVDRDAPLGAVRVSATTPTELIPPKTVDPTQRPLHDPLRQ